MFTAKIENLSDLCLVRAGVKTPDQVRIIEVNDALLDSKANTLCMPKRLIVQLGLTPQRQRPGSTSAGPAIFQVFDGVRLTIQGRDCHCDVLELPDNYPVLIGIAQLGLLDFVVDPIGQQLIGNPEHGGEQMYELYTPFLE